MKEFVVISGKGGTGKTSIVAAFAALAEKAVLADCDVDAADLHLVIEPRVQRRELFKSGRKAFIRQDACTQCGLCQEYCRFDAIHVRQDAAGSPGLVVDSISCEGCGVCVHFCPEDAIDFPQSTSGEWFVSETRHGPMVHARLGIAEENSGKLVTLIRTEAKKLCEERDLDLIIVDGSPGIGCPVIAAITGTSLVLLVTEPTMSGLHDLERVVALAGHFGTPAVVCVNKSDINPEMTEKIVAFCQERQLRVIGRVPYDAEVTGAQLAGRSVVEHGDAPAAQEIRRMWREVITELG